MGVLSVALIVGAASFAMAGIPDLGLSSASRAYVGGETLSLWNLPDGTGNALTAAFLPGGAEADATISVELLDGLGVPVPNYPFEDMNLACDDGLGQAMVPCAGGASADFNTDVDGLTTFQTPLNAGGWSTANTVVLIAGAPLTSGDIALRMNSSDMSGDGLVNLTDVGMFSPIFYGPYSFAADFNNDGLVNLADVGRLSAGNGKICP
jgi:hypothetical protein